MHWVGIFIDTENRLVVASGWGLGEGERGVTANEYGGFWGTDGSILESIAVIFDRL